MKIRELLKLTDRHLPQTARSITADETGTIVAPAQIPNRLAGPQERGRSGIFPDADPSDGMSNDLLPALDRSPTSFPMVPTPHSRDLDFIKAQIARLPRHSGQ
jgi:hypothetical protein